MWTWPGAQPHILFPLHLCPSRSLLSTIALPEEKLGWWDFISRWVLTPALPTSPLWGGWGGLLFCCLHHVQPMRLLLGCLGRPVWVGWPQFGYLLLGAVLTFTATVERGSWWAAAMHVGGTSCSEVLSLAEDRWGHRVARFSTPLLSVTPLSLRLLFLLFSSIRNSSPPRQMDPFRGLPVAATPCPCPRRAQRRARTRTRTKAGPRPRAGGSLEHSTCPRLLQAERERFGSVGVFLSGKSFLLSAVVLTLPGFTV